MVYRRILLCSGINGERWGVRDAWGYKFELYVWEFQRWLTEHKCVWVHNIETGKYFQWNGFSLGILKKAVQPYLLQAAGRQ